MGSVLTTSAGHKTVLFFQFEGWGNPVRLGLKWQCVGNQTILLYWSLTLIHTCSSPSSMLSRKRRSSWERSLPLTDAAVCSLYPLFRMCPWLKQLLFCLRCTVSMLSWGFLGQVWLSARTPDLLTFSCLDSNCGDWACSRDEFTFDMLSDDLQNSKIRGSNQMLFYLPTKCDKNQMPSIYNCIVQHNSQKRPNGHIYVVYHQFFTTHCSIWLWQ